jgi:hypothetical protein
MPSNEDYNTFYDKYWNELLYDKHMRGGAIVGDFQVKDSGKREQFESGMVRDTTEGKTDYTLVLDGPMFKRWAVHLTKGAVKYKKRNWMQANGEAEYDRFRESALRHFLQWIEGDRDEDHAAAVMFNINGAEYVSQRMTEEINARAALYDSKLNASLDKLYSEYKKETI